MEPREIKERATQLFTKGKFAKAAEAFEAYCKADDRDVQARLRMGDAWAKAGKKDKAVHAYTRAAEGFAKEGFLPRAIAASKLILELDPAHQGVQKMLADLYARKSGNARAPSMAKGLSNPNALPAPAAPAVVEVPAPVQAEPAVSGPATAPGFANRADAIEIDFDEPAAAPPPAKRVERAPFEAPPLPPPLDPIEVPAWELPPAAPIEIEVGDSTAPDEQIEIDLSSAEVELPTREAPIELTAKKSTPPPEFELELEVPAEAVTVTPGVEPDLLEVTLDVSSEPLAAAGAPLQPPVEMALEAALRSVTTHEVTPTESSPPPSAPPGLKPRRSSSASTAAASPLSAPSTGAVTLAAGVSVVAPETTRSSWSTGSARSSASGTELERSLEAFSQFDVEAPPAAPLTPAKPKVEAPRVASFTELELDGDDSLLQAVEAAAGKPTSPSVSVSTEEVMEALDEPKLEPGALPKIPLFSDLPPEAFIALFEQCPLRRAEPGDVIIEQGSQGESFFVICAGTAKVFRHDDGKRRELAGLEEGAFFGEMALLSDAPRSASVEAASEDTQLLEIPATVLTELSRQHPTIASALKKFCRQRLLSNLMNGATLFRPFTKTERRDLVQKFRARDVNRGETLIREGERSDGLYVILTGEVGVHIQNRSVATLKEGDVFGELSLLTRTAATATVQTTKKTSLLRLPREDFDAIIMSHPQILEQVAELTDARTRKNAELMKSKASAQSLV